jgi:hypothetical protein
MWVITDETHYQFISVVSSSPKQTVAQNPKDARNSGE